MLQSLIDAVLHPVSRVSESLIQQLSQECPLSFGQTHQLQCKALHKLKVAREQGPSTRSQFQSHALSMYKDSAHISNFDMKKISHDLLEEQYFSGVVDLALHRINLLAHRRVTLPRPPGKHLSISLNASCVLSSMWLIYDTCIYVVGRSEADVEEMEFETCFRAMEETLGLLNPKARHASNVNPNLRNVDHNRFDSRQAHQQFSIVLKK